MFSALAILFAARRNVVLAERHIDALTPAQADAFAPTRLPARAVAVPPADAAPAIEAATIARLRHAA